MSVATVSDSSALTSFPLERPRISGRRRDNPLGSGALPYFLCGEENRLVAYLATGDLPVFELGNPLLLIGPSGCGKTVIALHLAARQTAISSDPEPPAVMYQTAVDFARHYAEAVAADDLQHFQQQIAEASVLVIDDLHLIADKPAAQEELAVRMEDRYSRNLPTIVTCRRLPSEVRGMRPLLVSRVLPGLTVPLSLPSGRTRIQLLSELAVHHQVDLSQQLLDELDSGLESTLPARALEAAIKQISLWCRMNDEPEASSEAIRAAIEVVGKSNDFSPAIIAGAVAKHFRMKLADLRSSSRKQHLVRARSLAMLLTRRMTSLSMHQIGEYFGGRDHTTVLHAIRKTESLLEEDPELRRSAEEVQEKLTAA